MNSSSTKSKLSLSLSPEASKVMPWVVAAKRSGDPKQIAWAKQEYERAARRTEERERHEREAKYREEQRDFWRRELLLERQQQEAEEEEAWNRDAEKRRKMHHYWDLLGIRFAIEEDGREQMQPSHASAKGWRRLLSEHADLRDSKRYGQWGVATYVRSNDNKRNCGRKPRKRWSR